MQIKHYMTYAIYGSRTWVQRAGLMLRTWGPNVKGYSDPWLLVSTSSC